ncbi:hypothetical protein AYI69_g8609 [Smittium culicis]|uniref:Uncharacterized protein n=1 Tax=Smittium culicis TaxID=133412 RepID=A0A1R1XIH2_9FUNG|nr:hypothetical protein AYI69_g8609 [Smittium culicis]
MLDRFKGKGGALGYASPSVAAVEAPPVIEQPRSLAVEVEPQFRAFVVEAPLAVEVFELAVEPVIDVVCGYGYRYRGGHLVDRVGFRGGRLKHRVRAGFGGRSGFGNGHRR